MYLFVDNYKFSTKSFSRCQRKKYGIAANYSFSALQRSDLSCMTSSEQFLLNEAILRELHLAFRVG